MEDPVIGREVDGYRILEVLGRGGMGVVYKAEDVALSRTIALKRIDPTLANDEAFLRRFRSEARALARIDSSYIVSVHALRQTDIGLLIVMEYVDGGTLKDLMLEGPMEVHQAMPIIKQMLQALEHAHGAEVIHRDIKPHNIMLTESGTVKVTDFGLAKVHRPDREGTVTQGVYGTLNYMSPEQVQGLGQVDKRSDLYSLGMTIYEMLAGRLPFDEDSSEFAIMRTIVEEDLPRPDQFRPEIPDRLVQIVMKAIAKDPDDRFQSARAMRKAFEAVEAKHGAKATPTTPATGDRPASPGADAGRSWMQLAGGALLLILLTIGGYVLYEQLFGGGASPTNNASTSNEGPPVSHTALSVSTEPTGASVYLNGRLIGVTPLDHTVEGDSAILRVQKRGYVPLDTMPQLGGGQPVRLDLQLAAADQEHTTLSTTPGTNDNTPDGANSSSSQSSQQTSAPARGTLDLSVDPTGTVVVEGQRYEGSASVELPAGRHRVQFRHPEYGTKDTTLTVRAGQTQTLTCYFEHTINVLSPDVWGNVYVDGMNTEQSTPHQVTRGPGTYRIELRIRRGSYTITGGDYRWKIGERTRTSTFSGNQKQITLNASFVPQRHVVRFHVVGRGS